MVSKDVLKQVVLQQKEDIVKDSIERSILKEIIPWIKDTRIIIITGLRRTGKSTLLQQIMNIIDLPCYVNFEDERFLDFRAQDFEILNEVLTEVYNNPTTYFFDEIQNVEKFESFVRRLQDQGKKIFITGSNARLLSREFGTKLTGRYKAFELYPFSFTEFLNYKKIMILSDDWYSPQKKAELLALFEEYLLVGGIPEYLKNKDDEYVRTIYENIIYKDIITRYSLKREKIIKELVNILSTNNTLPITYNALKEQLGLSNSITVKEYIGYLNNSYLFFELPQFSYSIKEQLRNPKKMYLIDPALQRVCGYSFSPNKGRLLENTVFIELKRKRKEIYFYKNNQGQECDFIIREGTRITKVIQVCTELTKENKERELKGLFEAMKTFQIGEGIILTLEQKEEVHYEGKNVHIIPLPQWLMGFN